MPCCPIPECLGSRQSCAVFCDRHWSKVPEPIRQRVTRLASRTRTRNGLSHRRAIREAIASLQRTGRQIEQPELWWPGKI